MICVSQGRQIPGLNDLHGLYKYRVVAWGESYGLQDLGGVSRVGYSCTDPAQHTITTDLGYTLLIDYIDDSDRNLSTYDNDRSM